MQIVGYCRFSWFGISDTGRELINNENGKQLLWDPVRMATRFHLFENVMLPSLRAQTDQNFLFYVLISEDLPEAYQARLEQVISQDSNVEILRTASTDIGGALKPTMSKLISECEKTVSFRLDDDDALACQYIENLRSIMEMHDLSVGSAITFPRGVNCFFFDGKAKHAAALKSFLAIGLAFVNGQQYQKNPFQVQHRKVAERQPFYGDPRPISFQRTIHLVNNTAGYKRAIGSDVSNSDLAKRILRNNPHLEQADVSPELDARINQVFPNIGGTRLREILDETLDLERLQDLYQFNQGAGTLRI